MIEGGEVMPRAVLKNGVIVPIDPVPPEWTDGRELWVEEVAETIPRENKNCPGHENLAISEDPEDDKRLTEAIARIRQQAKSMARRQLGLPE
jgi:hypothetical protein